MIEVNRKGIERTHRAMGGEGTLVLALQTDQSPAVETLDAAIPLEDGEGPANGGWFPGPRSWMLLVEGLDDVIYPWFDELARRLDASGVSGTLTGAGSVETPVWSRRWPHEPHTLDAAYETGPEIWLWDSPGANEQLIRDLVDSTVNWLGADGARIRVGIQFSAHFWMDARATALMMRREVGPR